MALIVSSSRVVRKVLRSGQVRVETRTGQTVHPSCNLGSVERNPRRGTYFYCLCLHHTVTKPVRVWLVSNLPFESSGTSKTWVELGHYLCIFSRVYMEIIVNSLGCCDHHCWCICLVDVLLFWVSIYTHSVLGLDIEPLVHHLLVSKYRFQNCPSVTCIYSQIWAKGCVLFGYQRAEAHFSLLGSHWATTHLNWP